MVISGHTWTAVYGKGIARGKQQNGKRIEPRIAKAVGAKLLGVIAAVLEEFVCIIHWRFLSILAHLDPRHIQAWLVFLSILYHA
jgi:hypothetical protein